MASKSTSKCKPSARQIQCKFQTTHEQIPARSAGNQQNHSNVWQGSGLPVLEYYKSINCLNGWAAALSALKPRDPTIAWALRIPDSPTGAAVRISKNVWKVAASSFLIYFYQK